MDRRVAEGNADCRRFRVAAHNAVCPKLPSKPLLAGFAHFDALAPFGVQDLVGAETAARVGVEDAINDVSTACLKRSKLVLCQYENENLKLTRCNVSIGA